MKKVKLNFLASLTAVAVIFSSCGSVSKMKDNASDISYSVSPKPLEVHGGEVEVTIETKFPPKYFNKKAIVEATPVINYSEGEVAYETTTVQGENVEANNKVISFEGGNFSYSGTVPYNEDMLESSLEMHMVGRIGDNEVAFAPMKVADGVIATSQLAEVDPQPILVGDKFERITPESYGADIHYLINRSNVRNSELRKEDIDQFKAALEEANTNERKEFKGMNIQAYASPDGEYDFNAELAEDRKVSSEKYLKNELKKAEVEVPEDVEFFRLMSTAEDWEGFKELVQESDIQDKELILRVLSMYSDPAVREREIRNLTEAFEELKDRILPELRRAKMQVTVDVIGYSDDELRELVNSNPDTLTKEEILYAATLFDENNQKLTVYNKAAANFPECFRAKNAVGVVNFNMGNYDAAKAAFEEAQSLKDNEVVKNNLGAVALANDDMETAEELISAGLGAGSAANYNMGIIKLKQGEYDDAISYFGSAPSYNAALARLLNGEPDAAMTTLGNVEDEDAMVFYLKAIAAARTQKQDAMLNNLRTAVGQDASLKERARKDLEFRDYRDNETFTSIVE